MKYYKRKLTDEQIVEMKRLRAEGMTFRQLAEKFLVHTSTIGYHLTPATKVKVKKRAMEWNKLHPETRTKWKPETHYRSVCFSLIRRGLREGYFTEAEVLSVLNERND